MVLVETNLRQTNPGLAMTINLQMSNNQAIALHALLRNLALYSSTPLPERIKQELLAADAENPSLNEIAEAVEIALLTAKRQQEAKAGIL